MHSRHRQVFLSGGPWQKVLWSLKFGTCRVLPFTDSQYVSVSPKLYEVLDQGLAEFDSTFPKLTKKKLPPSSLIPIDIPKNYLEDEL